MPEARHEFWRAKAGVDFLFGPEVAEYLDQINTRASKLHVNRVSQQAAQGEQFSKHLDAETEGLEWFMDQLRGNLQSVFSPYLAFTTWRARQ